VQLRTSTCESPRERGRAQPRRTIRGRTPRFFACAALLPLARSLPGTFRHPSETMFLTVDGQMRVHAWRSR
jgi:hypothetical protein